MPLKEVNWDEFQFRCHYFGELMTRTRGKTNLEKYEDAKQKLKDHTNKLFSNDVVGKAPTNTDLRKLNEYESEVKSLLVNKDDVILSDTCKKRLAQIYTEETTGRKKNIESLYIEKGLETEEESITKYSLLTGKMYRKNKERRCNGFVCGEIDFDDEEENMTIDAKGSWDIFTFDATVAKAMGNAYWWQGQMYMWLWDRDLHRLAYCLNNTPNEILNKLENRLFHNFVGSEEEYKEAIIELRYSHIFDDLPLKRKIRTYTIQRDEDAILEAQRMIPHFRNFLKNIPNNKPIDHETTQ